MKKLWMTAIIVGTAVVALTLSGCSSLGEMAKDWEASASDANLRYDIRHEQQVSEGETVQLILDLEVSDVTIEAIAGNDIQFTQKANQEKLLAEMSVKSIENGQAVTFKTPSRMGLNSGNQSARATLGLPKGVNYVIETKVAVGSVEMQASELVIKSADFSLDVGDLVWSATTEQAQLKSLTCQVDVGNAELSIGAAPQLESIVGQVNVGNVEIYLEAPLKQALELEAKADVGDVKVVLPKAQGAVLRCDIPEFVGDLDFKGLEYSEKNGEYRIEGSDDFGIIEGNLSVGTGNVTLVGK